MSRVRAFYEANAERESGRLDQHRTELAITLRALDDHLPPPPGRVIDVGGGPGRYAVELARRGYEVTLVDLSPRLAAIALAMGEREGVAIDGTEGDARDLSRFADESFDAVLLLGPLYHLFTDEDRRGAVDEAWRVLCPGGVLFAAALLRYAPMRWAAKHDPELLVREPDAARAILEDGLLVPPGQFVDAYCMNPGDLEPLMADAGFERRALLGCEGLVSFIEERVNELSGAAWEAWVDLNYRAAQDPALLGASEHILYVGSKVA